MYAGRNELRHCLWLIALFAAGAVHAKELPKPLFIESTNQTLAPPPADQAQILFVEPINKIQGRFPVGIFELDGDKRTLLAVTAWKSKIAVLLPPRKHMLYASQGGVGHIMEANVAGRDRLLRGNDQRGAGQSAAGGDEQLAGEDRGGSR